MAISMCSENSSLTSSPRISFSHDLHHTDMEPIEHYPYRSDSLLLNPNSDFDFPVNNTVENEPSSADELFSQGLIRPLQLQQKFVTSKQVSLSHYSPLPIPSSLNQEISKEIVTKGDFSESDQIKKHPHNHQQAKSFWRIKRSSSLHCDNTYKKSSFWSLPLLSRSNSTGSVPISKNSSNQKQIHSNSQKQSKNSGFYNYPVSSQKPPPYKKNYGGAYGNGIRISPVLNVPPPFISKGTANLFGLGSFFRTGKDRKNKK